MTKMTLPAVGTAMVPVGTPTFAELLDRLARRSDLTATRRRDLASGLRRVAAALQLDPVDVQAHMPWLQPRIAAVSFRALGLSPKSWSNILSDCRAAITVLDRAKPRVNRRGVLTPDWRRLWDELIAADTVKSIERSVGAFVFFLSRIGVTPDQVTNSHAMMFRDELMANQIRKVPEETYRRAIAGWNRAVRQWSFWPRRMLSAPSRLRVIRIGRDDAPPSFYADLDQFLDGLAHPDPFDDDAVLKPLRPASIKSYKDCILLFAGALVRSGTAVEEITGLDVLVRPALAKQGLTWLIDEAGGQPMRQHYLIAQKLVASARRHVRPAADDLKALEQMLARVKKRHPRQRGLTEKNLDGLRELRDASVLATLLRLPDVLFARGQAMGATPQGLILQRDALMLAVLRHYPIRRKNLIELRLDHNVQRIGSGKAYLVVGALGVKNRQHIEFEMIPELLAMIDSYVAVRSPLLCPKRTPWLFSNREGTGHLSDTYVSTRVSQIIRRELGLAFNPHLARHTAAYVYLSERPGHYEEVRRLLGHSSTSSTLDVYAGFETDAVGRQYSAFITESLNAAPKERRRK